ncbi:MAG: division/cell wall cluster transcriptional repressor MraZ [Candidatus Dormibacteraeota bacterium]|nr:division/cell wall cluster transcriptional repressor MraZ [Candidatus Dormibacteraeota bacterium]
MFLGKHDRNLDEKGRLAIPAKFREQLPSGSVITVAPEECVRVYPPGEWDVVTLQNRVSAGTGSENRNLARVLFSMAAELEFDAQGRTRIPTNLREKAGIADSVVVVGVNNVVEIWSQARWKALEENASDITRLSDEVASRRVDTP